MWFPKILCHTQVVRVIWLSYMCWLWIMFSHVYLSFLLVTKNILGACIIWSMIMYLLYHLINKFYLEILNMFTLTVYIYRTVHHTWKRRAGNACILMTLTRHWETPTVRYSLFIDQSWTSSLSVLKVMLSVHGQLLPYFFRNQARLDDSSRTGRIYHWQPSWSRAVVLNLVLM